MKKALIFALAIVSSIGIAVAQERKTTPQTPASAQASENDPVVIRAGTTEVRKSEFEAAIRSLPPEYQAVVQGPAKRNFGEEFARMKMLADAAEKDGLDKDPDVQAQLRLMRANTLATAQLTRLQQSIDVPEAAVKKAYEEQKGEFETARARHILIAFAGSPAAQAGKPPLSEEQARAKAEQLRTRLVAGGDFAEAAAQESDDTMSGARGGDLGEFGRGDMVPEFEAAVFNGKVGEIAPLVRTQFGYHIIQVQERSTQPLAQVREQLEGRLRQEMLRDQIDAMTGAITYDESYFPQGGAGTANGHEGHDH